MRDVRHELAPRVVQTALLGDVVQHGDHATLAVERAVGRERHGQHPAAARDLAGEKGAHRGLIRADHLQILEHLVEREAVLHPHTEEIFGRRVHMDEASVGREGRNAIGHVQEQGVQLVALALHLADRGLETARHVVERARQLADLVARLHAEVLIEVALRD